MSEFSPTNPPSTEHPLGKREVLDTLARTLEAYGVSVVPEERLLGSYRLSFNSDDVLTTVRILLNDYSGVDVMITNMTVFPADEKSLVDKTHGGYGSRAIKTLISWAQANSLNNIRATQVSSHNEGFWVKQGFVKCDEPNPTGDYVYTGM